MLKSELMAILDDIPGDPQILVADWNENYREPTPLTRTHFDAETNAIVLEESD